MYKLIIGALAIGIASPALAGSATVWKVSEATGSVQILHGGASRVAVRSDVVDAGDTVTTGRNGRAVLVRGSEFVMVAPASQLRVSGEDSSSGVTRLFQDFGNAVFMIKKKLTPHFEVKTPYLAAVVKGTTFTVAVTPTGASVQVLEGAVDVATKDGGAHDLITPGTVALVGARDLYQLQVEGVTGRRVIESSAKHPDNTAPPPVPAESPVVATSAPPRAAPEPVRVAQPAIVATVHSESVALADVTNGLVSGQVGGAPPAAELKAVSLASADTIEAANTAVKVKEAATATVASKAAEDVAKVSSDRHEVATEQSAKAQEVSTKAAKEAEAAEKALAEATAEKAKGEAAKTAADDVARIAAQEAAAADTQAALAAADRDAKKNAEIEAHAAATHAAKEADDARKAAEAEAAKAANSSDPDILKAAEKAAKDAEKAAKDAEEAQKRAVKTAEDAAKAVAEQAAKEAEKLAKAADADKAAKELEKAAKDAEKAAKDQAAKEAEKAAKDAEKAAAKAAADAAKAEEDAAKQAKKAADEAAKAAEKAEKDLKDKAKDTGDALDEVTKALLGKGK